MHDLQGTQLPSSEWKQRSSNMIRTACTYMVWMARRGEKVPLAMVWSLLSYKERRFRLCRSWKASTRRQFILLAFNNLFDQIVVGLKGSTSWTYLQVSVLEKKTNEKYISLHLNMDILTVIISAPQVEDLELYQIKQGSHSWEKAQI